MSHALIDRLTNEYDYPIVTCANHDAFVARPGLNVLFFPGDTDTVRDATDVAVVLPELVRAFDGALHPGVVTDVYGDGKTLRRHYGFGLYPSLVFVRDGAQVGTISRIKDWADYVHRIERILAASPPHVPAMAAIARRAPRSDAS